MKNWQISKKITEKSTTSEVIKLLLENRGFNDKNAIAGFISPKHPRDLTCNEVGIDSKSLKKAIVRIQKAITKRESIVVYADYDADGITAGTIMWETLFKIGGKVMPYIPHRIEEGYGLSIKGIDSIIKDFNPKLIITVDQGITGKEKVEYAKSKGIDVIVTDHHTLPSEIPDCTTVHTTKLSGAGIAWFVANQLIPDPPDLLAIAAIGTISDMMALVGVNRSIAKYGLEELNTTKRIGLTALIKQSGLSQGSLGTYEISFMLSPRLNAAGRLEHAMDAMRLLCTRNLNQATQLASKLDLTNKDRQQLTTDSTIHAIDIIKSNNKTQITKKILIVAHEEYNQGVIGLVAGRLVEEFYRPSIVIAIGEEVSKGSVRSITGFNIIDFLRQFQDLLVDVGGHPMAAGFTIETSKITEFQVKLEQMADSMLTEEMFTKILSIDLEIPLTLINSELWEEIFHFEPFGFGNPEPVFASYNISVVDARTVGADGKHLKLKVASGDHTIDAIGFGMGNRYGEIVKNPQIDIAYTIDMNEWNGTRKIQLKLRDIHISKLN